MRSKNEKLMNDILFFINDSFFSGGGVPSVAYLSKISK